MMNDRFKKDNETKTFEWNGKTYTSKEVDSEYYWVKSAEYCFYCDKPANPLCFLGLSHEHKGAENYNVCYFKEVDSDTYYKMKDRHSNLGWDGSYDGKWAWISNIHPYPNTPINVAWDISPTYDAAEYSPFDEYAHISWKICTKPDVPGTLIGQWKFRNSGFNESYPNHLVRVNFYKAEDSSLIYRRIRYINNSWPSEGEISGEEWYETTGRQWPGKTDSAYDPDCTVIEGLIETGTVTLVTGPLHCGKSHLIGQLCTSINNSTPFLGMATRFGKAVHIDCDTNDRVFGSLYGDIDAFYGSKCDMTWVIRKGTEVAKGLSPADLLTGIEKCCKKNKDICLVAIDSIDLLDLSSFCKTRDFIKGLKRIADDCKVAIVYSCTANSVLDNAADLAETCDPNGLHAGKSDLIIGIVQDPVDKDSFYVHFDNKFDVDCRIKCRKNKETNYCFDVIGMVDTVES